MHIHDNFILYSLPPSFMRFHLYVLSLALLLRQVHDGRGQHFSLYFFLQTRVCLHNQNRVICQCLLLELTNFSNLKLKLKHLAYLGVFKHSLHHSSLSSSSSSFRSPNHFILAQLSLYVSVRRARSHVATLFKHHDE